MIIIRGMVMLGVYSVHSQETHTRHYTRRGDTRHTKNPSLAHVFFIMPPLGVHASARTPLLDSGDTLRALALTRRPLLSSVETRL